MNDDTLSSNLKEYINMKRIIFIIITIFSFINTSYAWFDGGHMIIVQIAYDDLSDQEKQIINKMILYLRDADPKTSDFIPSAAWIDGIRSAGFRFFDTYHYSDTLYNPDNLSPEPKSETQNLVWALKQCIANLKNNRSSEFTRAIALRMLIHLAGDAHQPMHAISKVIRINSEIKTDRGGNEFLIKPILYGTYFDDIAGSEKPNVLDNLHKLWDSGVMGYESIQALKYDKEKNKIVTEANDIKNFVKALGDEEKKQIAKQITEMNIESWISESYQLAIDNAYSGIKEGKNEEVSQKYIERGKKICKIQLFVAGKRLALVLHDLFLR